VTNYSDDFHIDNNFAAQRLVSDLGLSEDVIRIWQVRMREWFGIVLHQLTRRIERLESRQVSLLQPPPETLTQPQQQMSLFAPPAIPPEVIELWKEAQAVDKYIRVVGDRVW
jgi:hypothetical protein